MCECKSLLEAKLLENFKQREPAAKNHEACLGGYGIFQVGNVLQLRPYMAVKYEATYTTSAGKLRRKRSAGSLSFRFCPFCGRGLDAAEPPSPE